jgi:phage tail sheath protein FI
MLSPKRHSCVEYKLKCRHSYLTVSEMSLSDAVDRGITVTEMAPMDQPIDVSRETTVAFVGRALRGPLNHPVLIRSFGEYRRRFGDVWTRSSLGPAVSQFFEHGGKNLYVVRVANDARGAMICLPANGSALVLRAIEPGSTENIRAAVDFDGIDREDDEHFNLILQRVDPLTGLVTDQEIFRRASYLKEADTFIGEMLTTSTLARVEQPFPNHRPEATAGVDTPHDAAYVEHAQEGSDGHELSDYDLVGSLRDETGLFALQGIDRFDLLYLPPPGKSRDLGPASLLAAEMYCRERGAMLIVDPANEWDTPARAVSGMRDIGMASPNMIGYFPRMNQRGDDDGASRTVGGALAGLFCKLDRTFGPWRDLDQQGMGLKREYVPAYEVSESDMQLLVREGLNVIGKAPAGRARVAGSVTMGRGSEVLGIFSSLPVRRLCLQIVNAIDAGTRWAVFEPDDSSLADRIRSQVTAYLSALANMGAFENDRFVVECDAGLCKREDALERGVTIFVTLQPYTCKGPISFSLHQTVAGCRVMSTVFAPVMEDCA